MTLPQTCIFLFSLLMLGCSRNPSIQSESVIRPEIIKQVPHDPTAFTQGLVIDGDHWLESTGAYGRSSLREIDRTTGHVIRKTALPRNLFGEGLALFQGKLYQLTWREGLCLVYDRETITVIDHFRYEGEGWGLTNCEQWLYMSNGSDTIQVRDPKTFSVTRTIRVQGNQGPIAGLNELEWIEGEIWANLFPSGRIVRFNPQTGTVIGFLDLQHAPLPADQHPGQDVLNGIAYDTADQSVWITGKNWSQLYQIAWPPPPAQ